MWRLSASAPFDYIPPARYRPLKPTSQWEEEECKSRRNTLEMTFLTKDLLPLRVSKNERDLPIQNPRSSPVPNQLLALAPGLEIWCHNPATMPTPSIRLKISSRLSRALPALSSSKICFLPLAAPWQCSDQKMETLLPKTLNEAKARIAELPAEEQYVEQLAVADATVQADDTLSLMAEQFRTCVKVYVSSNESSPSLFTTPSGRWLKLWTAWIDPWQFRR